MSTKKPPRTRARQPRRARPPPPPGIPPFSAVMAGASGEVAEAITMVRDALNTSAGAFLVQLLMVENMPPEQAAKQMGLTPAQLRDEGLRFATRFSNAVAPDLFPLTPCAADEMEAEIAKAKGLKAGATANAPGTLI